MWGRKKGTWGEGGIRGVGEGQGTRCAPVSLSQAKLPHTNWPLPEMTSASVRHRRPILNSLYLHQHTHTRRNSHAGALTTQAMWR